MADTTAIKKGAVIRHQDQLYIVTDFQFVNPGKGAAFFKTKLKGLSIDKGLEITYKSGENVDVVEVYKVSMQYLYHNGSMYSFMNQDTYETVDIPDDILGNDAKYLKEGLIVIVSTHEGTPVSVQLPKKVTYKVASAPPAVKGDTASGNVTKDVELENGLGVKVPIFIKEGEEILVNTETGDYDSRAQV
ncbi:MAG: elongation factor P [Candidatus Magasanikbacteria bacterium]|nr:elongation factor P [Candidatus Magasanikbacteria bacterium]